MSGYELNGDKHAQIEHIEHIKKKYSPDKIRDIIEKFKNTKVLVVGDAIIDEYHFTIPKGRATKDPILSVDYVNHEMYAGGVLAIANHVSNFVQEITCVTFLGDKDDKRNFILNAMNKNIGLKFFIKEASPTITKKRYLDSLRNEKLFKVEYINDKPISGANEREFINYLEQEIPKYDVVMVGDFGHGIITENVIKTLEKASKFLAVNAQCNSSNLGFNYVTKYHTPAYVSMDIHELMYALSDRFSEVPILMNNLHKKTQFNRFMVTMSKRGAGYFNNGTLTFSPAFVIRPLDTIGAGDAVFSITSLFAYLGIDELIPFMANCVGGVAVSYLGNKESVNKQKLLSFIDEVYNGAMKLQ